MAYLAESQAKLLQQILTTRDIESYALQGLIGWTVGSNISLLGTTQDKRSLNSVYAEINKIISEVNELYPIDVETAIDAARQVVVSRYDAFFNFSYFSPYFTYTEIQSMLTQKISREEANDLISKVQEYLGHSQIRFIIHNQNKETAPASEPAEKPAIQQTDSQPVSEG